MLIANGGIVEPIEVDCWPGLYQIKTVVPFPINRVLAAADDAGAVVASCAQVSVPTANVEDVKYKVD